MKILMIGGTGIISSAVSELLLARGHSLSLLVRGHSIRPLPAGAEVIRGDIRKPDEVLPLLQNRSFDAVVDWLSFVPEHIETAIRLFEGRTGQYVFISSASAYRKPAS